MFEKFGEIGSAEKLNELAENLVNEGDYDSLKALAKENGIDEEFANDFINGNSEQFVDTVTAAVGKISVETDDLKPKGLMEDWVSYIEAEAMEDENLAKAVRREGKSLKGCMAALLEVAFQTRQAVDKGILDKVKLNPKPSRVEFGVPNMREAKKIIRDYYLGGKE